MVNCLVVPLSSFIFIFELLDITKKVMVFNATFNNISVISWRSVLLVEETRNHWPIASHSQTLSRNIVSSTPRHKSNCHTITTTTSPKLILKYLSAVIICRWFYFTGIVCGTMFVISLCFATSTGSYVFSIFDSFSANIPLLIIAFIECVAMSYIYGLKRYGRLK